MRSLLIALVLCACSDDATTPAAVDAGAQQPADAAVDTGTAKTPVRCTDAEFAAGDAATPEVSFPLDGNPVQYVNRCLSVKVGTSVTFKGSFSQHPLEPKGGDSPSPITLTRDEQTDGALVVSFPKAGTFGFQCEFHPSLMFGAIRVIP